MDRTRLSSGPAAGPRLTIIVVNYESWPDVVRLAGSLLAEPEARDGRCEVVVVDNASTGPIPDDLRAGRPGLRLIARPDNGGFAAGVNAGWGAARGAWLLVLNPDVDIAPGFLRRTFGRLDDYESRSEAPPGIVGFGLLNADGSPQGSVGAFPSLGRSIREQFIPRSRRKYRPARWLRPGPVDWVTGACMLVRADLMRDLGGMDEDFFLYHEEVAFCRVAGRRGWRIEFDPSVRVVHRHPLQNRAISPKMRVITRHSKLLYFHKHLPAWQFRSLVTFVRLESAIRACWSGLRRRRDEVHAWRVIGEVARRASRGDWIRGRSVLSMAESIAQPPPVAPASSPLPVPSRRSHEPLRMGKWQPGTSDWPLATARKEGSA